MDTIPAKADLSDESRWIFTPAPNPQAAGALYCFPYAGGGSWVFRSWVDAIPPSAELRLVRLPGRAERWGNPPVANMSNLVEAICDEIGLGGNRPVALFGHSLGGLLAFEVAREIRRRGWEGPAQLIVSASPAPHVLRNSERLHTLPDALFIEALRRRGEAPSEALREAELMRLLLPGIRADFQLVEEYSYVEEPPLACPIAAFAGTADTEVALGQVLAWRQQTCAEFSFSEVSGGHLFLLHSPRPMFEELSRIIGGLW